MKKLMIGIVVLVVGVLVCAQQAPQGLPGRAPMHAHLLKPSAEWMAYYDVAPDDQRALYWTTKALLDAAREQAKNIQELDARVKALEAWRETFIVPNEFGEWDGWDGIVEPNHLSEVADQNR